jgi:uncharacterized repeat protein (TIGR04052 family)
MRSSLRFTLPLLLLAASIGCAGEPAGEPVALTFAGMVGERPFVCGETYDAIGSSATSFTAMDFRFYLHDVRLVTEDGAELPVTLDDDGVWQNGEVALLDFETGGACMSGNAATRELVTGSVVTTESPVVALRFRLGVPEHLNHVHAAAQPAPMNVSSLFWGWSAGYDFIRVDGATPELEYLTFLLGATDCTGDARMGTRTCANGNRPEIEIPIDGIEAFTSGTVVADLSMLFATTDLSTDGGGAVGCHSEAGDPECETLLAAVGLDPETDQHLFRFQP